MKKIILGALVVIILIPSVSLASNQSDLEVKRIELLKQLIVLLEQRIEQLQTILAQKHGITPTVLGVATSTDTTTEKSRRRGGGGGGSSRRSTPVTVVEDTASSTATTTPENNATSTATTTPEVDDELVKRLVLSTTTVFTNTDVLGSDDNFGVFEITFSLSAENEDFYITNYTGNNLASTTKGFAYSIEGPDGFLTQSNRSLQSTAEEVSEGVYVIKSGESEEFTLYVTMLVDISGNYRLNLTEINYTKFPDGVTGTNSLIPEPASVFRTAYRSIIASSDIDPDTPLPDMNSTSTLPYDAFLKISSSNNDPDASYIEVSDTEDTEAVHIFSYTIEAEDGDITLDRMVVKIDTPNGDLVDIIDEVRMSLNGQQYSPAPFDTILNGQSELINASSAWFLFDFDTPVALSQDVAIEVDIVVDLNGKEGNYNNNQQILASIGVDERTYWEAEGYDDLLAPDEFPGSATGEVHILITEGIIIPADNVETETDTQGENDTLGIFTIDFEVTAFQEDFYIANSGVNFTVSGGTATTTFTVTSTGDEDAPDVFTVADGETESFTLSVTVDPNSTGQFRVTLDSVSYSKFPDGVTQADTLELDPASDYRTSFQLIQS